MPYYISQEKDVNAYPLNEFMAFYENELTLGTWKQASGVDIFYGYVINKSAHKCIVISQGRSESLIKYAEFVYELYKNGYSVFMFDHQGQGESSRLLDNRQIGFVGSFNDYVDDMHGLLDKVLNPILRKHEQHNVQKILMCHSMGGAIGALYIQAHPAVFAKLVMSAPMIGVLTPVSEATTYFIFSAVQKARNILGMTNAYVWGQGDYQAQPFAKNPLTNCPIRYRVFREMMAKHSQNQLGGISFTWLLRAIDAMRTLRSAAPDMLLPVLVFQAQQEQIVDNVKMTQFVEKLPNCTFIKVDNAKHELLFEKDAVRAKVLTKMLAFIES